MVVKREVATIDDWLNGEVKEDSERDREIRRTITRLLRENRAPEALRSRLAALIDPDLPDLFDDGVKLVVRRPARPRGRPKADDAEIALVIEQRLFSCPPEMVPKKEAYAYAVEKLGISYSQAEKAYARCLRGEPEALKQLLRMARRINRRSFP